MIIAKTKLPISWAFDWIIIKSEPLNQKLGGFFMANIEKQRRRKKH